MDLEQHYKKRGVPETPILVLGAASRGPLKFKLGGGRTPFISVL
jgi:hypothetical protein